MTNNIKTTKDLLDHLRSRKLIDDQGIHKISDALAAMSKDSGEPFYIKFLAGLGAWFSAIFILSFISQVTDMPDDSYILILTGILFMAAAMVISKSATGVFLRQLSLALAISGNLSLLFGVAVWESSDFGWFYLVCAQAIVCVVVYPVFPNAIYRFLAPIGLVTMFVIWIVESELFFLMHFLTAVTMLTAGALFLRKDIRPPLTPLAYSAAAVLPAAILFMTIGQTFPFNESFMGHFWPSSVILALGLIYLFIHLADGSDRIQQPWLILAVACTILLGIFTTPGVLVVAGLLVLGFAFQDIFLSGLAYIFLPCFLFLYYYALNIDLAYKSFIVAGSGLVLIIARWLASFLKPEEVAQ